MNEQNPYTAGKERHTGHSAKGTLEVVQLEKQNAPLPRLQRIIISVFAVIGVLAVLGAIAVALFGR